jgi:hypothetical protein
VGERRMGEKQKGQYEKIIPGFTVHFEAVEELIVSIVGSHLKK